jgi:HAD superfamily hydrolase (TIGR01484 family)
MRFHALATDYDGTLAHHGIVEEQTVKALERTVGTGRKLILVTGRELPDLLDAFPHLDLFEMVVAENGALLYRPATKEERLLSEAPPQRLIETLRSLRVEPMSVGRGIIGLWEPHQHAALEAVRQCGLEWQVIFNKGAVMLLPAGVNKAFGLVAALEQMGLSPHNVVGVGDAENDHAFLRICELSAAVANALPAVKQEADLVTQGDHGDGVIELIEAMIADELAEIQTRLVRHELELGEHGGRAVTLPAYGATIMVCGASGSGKSTLVTRIVETLVQKEYQFCLVDPEGDYQGLDGALALGGPGRLPDENQIVQLLSDPHSNAIADLTGLPIPERPPFFLDLLPRLLQMRTRVARPHWLIFDEAHHLMPSDWKPTADAVPDRLHTSLLITNHPELLSRSLLAKVDFVIAVGAEAWDSLVAYCEAGGVARPSGTPSLLPKGQALYWARQRGEDPVAIVPHLSDMQRRRHRRKYAEGQLSPEQSFYFRGSEKKLNLPAHNLTNFLLLADGLDDNTWEFHRRRNDYSRWFRDSICDETLADAVESIESESGLSPAESRARIRSVVEERYDMTQPSPVRLPGAE